MTPEDILSHPARVLTPEQRRYYFDHGHVVLKNAIDRSRLEASTTPSSAGRRADY